MERFYQDCNNTKVQKNNQIKNNPIKINTALMLLIDAPQICCKFQTHFLLKIPPPIYRGHFNGFPKYAPRYWNKYAGI